MSSTWSVSSGSIPIRSRSSSRCDWQKRRVRRVGWVSWPTAHRALIAAAARWLPEPTPTRRLRIDETRFRSVRWILDGVSWKRSGPWLTSFVDCSRDGPREPARTVTGPYRRLRARMARRADSSVPRHNRAGRDRPVSAVRRWHPGRSAEGAESRSTSGIWLPSPTPRLPRCGSASLAISSAAAAPSPTRSR